MQNLVEEFMSRGGHFMSLDKNGFLSIPYYSNTVFKPFCSAGINRSTVTREFLIKNLPGNVVFNQHAGNQGACPVHDGECVVVPSATYTDDDDGFKDAFNHPRVPRFGEMEFYYDKCGGFYDFGENYVDALRNFYKKNYFECHDPTIFIGYSEGATNEVLQYIMESNGDNLEHITLVFINWGDYINHPESSEIKARSPVAFLTFYDKLSKSLQLVLKN